MNKYYEGQGNTISIELPITRDSFDKAQATEEQASAFHIPENIELHVPTIDLPAGYDKLSFVVGPDSPNSASDKYNAIVTVKADGNRVFDKVIWEHDAPQEYTVDLKGARQLRFDIPKGEAGWRPSRRKR